MQFQPSVAIDEGTILAFDRALPEVYHYLLHRCRQRSVAEDLTSETFLAARAVYGDDMWRASYGPQVFASLYGGEHVDARLDQPNWSDPGFDASDWQIVLELPRLGDRMVDQVGHPCGGSKCSPSPT